MHASAHRGALSPQVRLILALLSSIFMLVPFCYIPASAAVFVVMERISKSKHLQLVSGANPRLYWLATFMWDLLVYLLVVSLCMVVFRVFNEPSLIGTFQQGAAIFCVLMLYGIAVLPLVYCYSFLFDSPTTAQISIIIFNFVAAFAMVIAHQIMKELPNTQAADAALVWLYRFLPGYNFGEAVINLTTNYYQGLLLGSAEPPFSWKVIGRPLLLMSFEAVGYFLLLLRIEASAQTYAKLEPCLALLCGVREPSIDLSRRSRFAIYAALIFIVVVLSSNITQPGGGLLLAAIVLSTAAGVLWYERRLRRTGARPKRTPPRSSPSARAAQPSMKRVTWQLNVRESPSSSSLTTSTLGGSRASRRPSSSRACERCSPAVVWRRRKWPSSTSRWASIRQNASASLASTARARRRLSRSSRATICHLAAARGWEATTWSMESGVCASAWGTVLRAIRCSSS